MIAHMRKSDYKIQSVQEHLEAVTFIAGKYGEKIGFKALTSLAGFLHDMGKNTVAFSTYIERAVKETGDKLEKIDHSTAGAKYLYEMFYVQPATSKEEQISNLVVEIVGMVILSHHSGLQNFIQPDGTISDYWRRIVNKDLPYYEEVCENFLGTVGNRERVETLHRIATHELELFLENLNDLKHSYECQIADFHFIYLGLLMKYIFSCLIDADRTDARRFDENDQSEIFPDYSSLFKNSYHHLMNHLRVLERNVDGENPINRLRSQMSEQSESIASNPSSIYRLSVPTGGGKTLASLRYALKHVQEYNKDRIIYIVPLTTILEQNADEVRKVIGNNEMVLEHHAYVIDELDSDEGFDYYDNTAHKRVQLARSNWDHPIMFTTLVQFLDTFYAKGTSKSRRLHHLTNSVIIFDEVQAVPVKHIPLFNSAVNFLHHFGNSSIVLCTATQPTLEKSTYPLLMPKENEMIPNLPDVVKEFKRVQVISKVTQTGWSAEQISLFATSELSTLQSILIILNTKRAVLNVYQKLKEMNIEHVYHLSTSMCPQHRTDILEEVRSKLESRTERIICVSTQLVEAGVNISFQCVIRSLTGLDAIAQAAGRCNRHGEQEKGTVYIIRSQDEVLTKLPEIVLGQEVLLDDIFSREQLRSDLLSTEAIETYFDYFLAKAERELQMTDKRLNVKLIELLGICNKYVANSKSDNVTFMKSMFKTLEQHFEVIESHTIGIIVPYTQRGSEIIALLNEDIHDYNLHNQLIKEAQLYSVNVYKHTLHKLIEEELIFEISPGMYALQHRGYHSEYGLSLEGKGENFLPIY